MTIEPLLKELQACGTRLRVKNDRLCVDAPKGALSADLRALLAERKQDVIDYIGRFRDALADLVSEPQALEQGMKLPPELAALAPSDAMRVLEVAEELAAALHYSASVTRLRVFRELGRYLVHKVEPDREADDVQPVAWPEIPDGWTPASWAGRLIQLAQRCEVLHPNLAAEYREKAAKIQSKIARYRN